VLQLGPVAGESWPMAEGNRVLENGWRPTLITSGKGLSFWRKRLDQGADRGSGPWSISTATAIMKGQRWKRCRSCRRLG